MILSYLKSVFLSVLLFFLITCTITAQEENIVSNQGITSPLHKANIGKIIFTEKAIPVNELAQPNFLSNYLLTNKSDLFVTVFLGNSNTNYLHQLAPALSADSLVKIGNYQFSFYIDYKLIYQTNLMPGAPRAALQNTETVWSKPLIDNLHEGSWWSQSAWNRFMYNGGDSILTEGHHVLKMEIRPYIKTTYLKVGPLIASGQLALLVKRHPVANLDSVKLSEVKPYEGFPVSKENFDQKKIKEMKADIEAGVFRHITSVAVIKNGKLLIEEYFNGATRDSLHDVRSVGKSFASTMTGIAEQENYLTSENKTLEEFYDLKSFRNYSPEKGRVSLKDLLTMSSTFDGNDDEGDSPGNEENMYPTDNWVKFALELPIDTVKYKGQWHYFTVGVVLLGDVLNKVVKEGLESYTKERLFDPLHISHYQWQYTPQHVVSTAGGIRMNTLDFAKYGQLYKNNGRWEGKQVIPASWIDKTFTKYEVIPGKKNEYYGYLFWNKTYQVKGKSCETYYCSGNGGNKIFVFKDQPLVVVVTATAYGTAYAHAQVDKMMELYILPAVLQ